MKKVLEERGQALQMEICDQKEGPIEPEGASKFSGALYFRTLTRILSSPGKFFSELPDGVSLKPAMGCLLVSSLFYACAGLTQPHDRPLLMVVILLLNAVVMCAISAVLGFGVMLMTIGRRVAFSKFFSVYAFSAAVTLLAAWIPLFVFITEPWKWLLISIGLIKGCGLRWFQAVIIMGISIFVMILFFWSLGPIILYLRG